MTKKSKRIKTVAPVHTFEVGKIYKANGKRYKVISIDGDMLKFAPVNGCVCLTSKAVTKPILVHSATKAQCVHVRNGHISKSFLNSLNLA